MKNRECLLDRWGYVDCDSCKNNNRCTRYCSEYNPPYNNCDGYIPNDDAKLKKTEAENDK